MAEAWRLRGKGRSSGWASASPSDIVVAGLAWVLLGVFRILLSLISFERLMRLVGLRADARSTVDRTGAEAGRAAAADDRAGGVPRRIGWAVTAAAARTPWASRCFAQALTGAVMLRAVRRPATVVLGVRPAEPSTGRAMTAHAWLVTSGLIITGAAGRDDFTAVAHYRSARARRWPIRNEELRDVDGIAS